MGVLKTILRAGEGRKVRALRALVADIGALEPEMQALTDAGLFTSPEVTAEAA